jgi:hypothetical protein
VQILKDVSRPAYLMGIRGYTEKVYECWCGVTTNVLWFSKLNNKEVLACTQEHANLPPPLKKGPKS